MITSEDNGQIKDVCRLMAKKRERLRRGLFIAEGERLVSEAPADRIVKIFCTKDYSLKHKEILIPGKTELVSDRVFFKMSDTDTPQGVLAVVSMADVKEPPFKSRTLTGTGGKQGVCGNAPFIIFTEDIRDPGNLGTIVRSAEAAGAAGIVMSEGTVDIYSPKVVRSTMGSIYRVAFYQAKDFYEDLKAAKKSGIRLYAAYLKSSIPYYEADYTVPCGILIGNEAAGLSEEAAGLADERIVIPMCGKVESLNAAVATSVIAFEARKQRNS